MQEKERISISERDTIEHHGPQMKSTGGVARENRKRLLPLKAPLPHPMAPGLAHPAPFLELGGGG